MEKSKILLLFLFTLTTTTWKANFAYAGSDLQVIFEKDPLFSQTTDSYWYPGHSKTRWVIVKNNSNEDKTVIIETFNESSTYPENLADVLELIISTDNTDIYGGSLGTKYLSSFYQKEELSLSTLLAKTSATYNFTISMIESAKNDWKGKDTNFDLKIGFFGVTPAKPAKPSKPSEPLKPTPPPKPAEPSVLPKPSNPGSVLGAITTLPLTGHDLFLYGMPVILAGLGLKFLYRIRKKR